MVVNVTFISYLNLGGKVQVGCYLSHLTEGDVRKRVVATGLDHRKKCVS